MTQTAQTVNIIHLQLHNNRLINIFKHIELGFKSLTVGDNLLISHSLADALSEESDEDLESLSEHTNVALHRSPLSDPYDAGDTRENCNTARSTLLR